MAEKPILTHRMPLPDLIEIVPLRQPVQAEVTVPGSKSITNRALILAALADGEVILEGALWSEDTMVMVDCLQELGFMVNVEPDPEEVSNRTITVYGRGGTVPRGGTVDRPLELFVGNAGTAARFLAAMVCLGGGVYRLHGVPRMHERPQSELFQALHQLGYRIDSENDFLPALIHGGGPRPAVCEVGMNDSSQFASALQLASRAGGWQIKLVGDTSAESPYVNMTLELINAFPHRGGRFRIEPDASSGSYFWAAGALANSRIVVRDWPKSGWQVDASFTDYLPLPQSISRSRDLADSILTAMILAPFADHPVRFTDLARLRVQECERVQAMRTELSRCHAEVLELKDTLTVSPSTKLIHGAEIETYNDHRMAMCFAVLGLRVPGIRIKNPSCVKKTFPDFFQKLAAEPPHGPGAIILNGSDGSPLTPEDLTSE